MKKKIALLLTLVCQAFAYQDLGKIGTTYPIAEEDILKQSKKKIEEIDRENIAKQAAAAAAQSLRSDAPYGGCMKDEDYVGPFMVRAQGLINLAGEWEPAPGAMIPSSVAQKQTACIVDGTSKRLFFNSLAGFEQRGIKCDTLMVSGVAIDIVAAEYNGKAELFPYHKLLSDTLGLDCMPSAAILEGDRKRSVKFRASEGER